jgi:DNA polymerase III subunit gamma/tau
MSKKTAPAADTPKPAEYRVLARKYRPRDFSELKGQDALVRTLTNAINTGRVAHAFMLTGVRGVGKTTTARIIARALNCEKGPTITPCGTCDSCVSIAADRNVDVIEMDAASRTGVDDVREIIDQVQYAPAAARYKVFIIDEVHMLSKNAFNALLKTLEEPPPHVKFIFATTEIRKVPVTVLSRCQRFDLKRIDAAVLDAHFMQIMEKEGVTAEPAAIALIARAADGSARDGLSLLDQAIAREGKNLTADGVRDMLGLADRALSLDLYEHVMKGAAPAALELLDRLHHSGAEPLGTAQDLLEITHLLTRLKVAPELAKDNALPGEDRARGAAMAAALPMPALARAWQMLLKGTTEVQYAPRPQEALEMLVIRLCYAADQPTPSDALKRLADGSTVAAGSALPSGAPRGTVMLRAGGAVAAAQPEHSPMPQDFESAVALFGQRREMIVQGHLLNDARLVSFTPGRIEINLAPAAPANLAGRVGQMLSDWTGARWMVSVSREPGGPTLAEIRRNAQAAELDDVRAQPIVAEILEAFKGAKIAEIL